MKNNRYTIDELRERQALPLSMKVAFSKTRIREWINYFGMDGVYLAYSAGMGSTVLSHLIDETFPNNDIPRVFCDTGLEYPEIREFAKKEPRVVFIKPRLTFRQVIQKYGYPIISKEVSECVYGARKYLESLTGENTHNKRTPYKYFYEKVTGQGKYSTPKANGTDYSLYSQERYKFFLEPDAPVISSECCKVMKKRPSHAYSKKTGRYPITGEQASESRLRTQKWLEHGCNGYDLKEPKKYPFSILDVSRLIAIY